MTIFVAFSSIGPFSASVVVVAAVGSFAFAWWACWTCWASWTNRANRAATLWHAISIISRLKFVSEIVFDSLTISCAESRGARSFWTWLRTYALTFVILVTRLFAIGVGGTMLGATVHVVDDPLIGVGQVLFSSDGKLEILISGDDRHFSVVRKGIWTIMHDGAVVIWHSKIARASLFVKVESHIAFNILKLNNECVITVRTTLLVMQTNGVSDFMERG